MSQDAFELHFVSADRLDVTSMEGVTTSYRRAERVALTADDLQAYAGRYGNDETSAVLDVAPGGSGLTVRIGWNEARPLTFAPVDRDTFQMGGMLLRFRRDSAGRIMALDYSNPVVRNVAFTRLPGQSERR